MWLVVINSAAGKGRAPEFAKKLVTLLDSDQQSCKVIDENSLIASRDAIEKALRSHTVTKMIAVGGDGLVNLCLQYVAQSEITLGVIAAGTGNDFARAVGFHKKTVEDIYDVMRNQYPQRIDLGKIVALEVMRWYVQVLSTGFDAEVNALANRIKWPKGKLKYTLATLFTLPLFKAIGYEIEIDGKQIHQNAMLITVANGQTYGGGMRICPKASNTDGFLDILLVHPVTKIVLLTIFPKVFVGKHIPHRKIDLIRGRVLRLSGDTCAYADGEFVSKLPIQIENVPNSLKTWVLK